jgi:hypothetical protein
MKTAEHAFTGMWRIVEMEVWDQEAFDLLGPAHFAFGKGSLGSLQFIAVQGQMDCRFGERDGRPCVTFSWSGFDDGDPASGRGSAVADGDVMTGRIFIHCGDDSAFTARRDGVIDSKPRKRERR